MVLLTRKEKEILVIKLANEGRTIRDIAKIVHMSLKDICAIIRKATGDEDPNKEEKEKEQQKLQKQKKLSPYAQAFHMYRENKALSEVVVELDLDAYTVLKYHEDYLILVKMKSLVDIYPEILDKYNWPLFFNLYKYIKKEGMNKESIKDLLKNQYSIADLENKVEFYNNHLRAQQLKIQKFEIEINNLRRKRDNYDGMP